MKKGLLGIGALMTALVSTPALAEQSIKARDLIQQIFGVDASTLLTAFATAGEGNSILGNVASVVNSVAMLGAAIIVLLTMTNGLLQTGEHGKIMGRYSAVWVPLRVMIAVGMLTPLNLAGYSVIQAAVLWGGMQGSNFADQALTYGTDYMSTNLRLAAPLGSKQTAATVAGLYQMEVCAAAVARAGEAAGGTFGVERGSATQADVVDDSFWGGSTTTSVVTLNYTGTGDYASTDALCGRMKIAHESGGLYSNGQELIQMRNLDVLRDELAMIAAQAVTGGLSGEAAREALRGAELRFADQEQRRVALFNTRLDALTADVRQNQLAKSADAGWVGAGAWYMTFAGMSAEAAASLADAPVFEPARLEEMADSLKADVKPLVSQAGRIHNPTDGSPLNFDTFPEFEADSDGVVDAGRAGQQWLFDALTAKGFAATRSLFDYALEVTIQDGTDPVVAMSQLGEFALDWAFRLFVVGLGIAGAGSVFSGGASILAFVGLVAPTLLSLAVIGVFLAYIIPAMPYVIWIAGVAGWVLMMVQAVVAAPLWAASHAMPDGEGFSGQRAMQGWMLLVSLLARPLLMVVGMIASMLVVKALGGVIFVTFGWAMSSNLLNATGNNPAHLVAWLIVFTGLFVVMARWSFSLIHLVPDGVLRFIGTASESIGENHIAEQARSMAVAAYGAASKFSVKIPSMSRKSKR